MSAMTIKQLLADVLADDCRVMYGIYDLTSCRVFAPHSDVDPVDPARASQPHLADPPATIEELEQIATRMLGASGA